MAPVTISMVHCLLTSGNQTSTGHVSSVANGTAYAGQNGGMTSSLLGCGSGDEDPPEECSSKIPRRLYKYSVPITLQRLIHILVFV